MFIEKKPKQVLYILLTFPLDLRLLKLTLWQYIAIVLLVACLCTLHSVPLKPSYELYFYTFCGCCFKDAKC